MLPIKRIHDLSKTQFTLRALIRTTGQLGLGPTPPGPGPNIPLAPSGSVSFCTFLAHEYPDLVHKVIMINGGGPTALEPSLCSIFNMPACVLHCLSPCLAWSFLK